MKIVNIYDAKRNLSRLVAEAIAGREIVIAKHGRPLVRLEPLAVQSRPLGLASGVFTVPDDFDEPLPTAVLESFNA